MFGGQELDLDSGRRKGDGRIYSSIQSHLSRARKHLPVLTQRAHKHFPQQQPPAHPLEPAQQIRARRLAKLRLFVCWCETFRRPCDHLASAIGAKSQKVSLVRRTRALAHTQQCCVVCPLSTLNSGLSLCARQTVRMARGMTANNKARGHNGIGRAHCLWPSRAPCRSAANGQAALPLPACRLLLVVVVKQFTPIRFHFHFSLSIRRPLLLPVAFHSSGASEIVLCGCRGRTAKGCSRRQAAGRRQLNVSRTLLAQNFLLSVMQPPPPRKRTALQPKPKPKPNTENQNQKLADGCANKEPADGAH